MVDPIFQDPELQAKFESQGYVKIPFLTQEEVTYLVELFWKLHPNLDTKGFQSSSYSSDYGYKKNASDLVTAVFKPHYERIFKNYRAFGSAYLYKQPDTYSELPVHQDWTIVDEEKYVALNIWVPLIDVTSFNGALHVMPGSHYGVLKPLRCPTLPMFFDGYEQLMIDNSIPMEVKAGEAVVLNQSIVHYSPPNKSDKIRIAITSGVMSAAPKMNFHYCPDRSKNEVEVIEMEDDFLISFENFYEAILKRPLMGKSLGFKPYTIPLLNEHELKDILLKMKERAGLPPILAESSPVKSNVVVEEKTAMAPPQKAAPSLLQRIASFFQTH
jgi:hypothetical protein